MAYNCSLTKIRMIFMCLSLLVASTQANAKNIHVGYFLVKPHAMPGSYSEQEGIAVTYFRLVADKMGLSDIQFSLFPLKRLLQELENNQLDMVLLLAKDPDRAKKYVYPRSSFCQTRPSIAINTDHALTEVKSIEALLPLRIQESAGAYRSPFIRDERLEIEPLYGDKYTARCFSKLMMGRIDACYQPDHYPLVFEAHRDIYSSKIRVIALPESPIGLYSVFSKQSSKRFLEEYENGLEEVQKEKSYEDLFKELFNKQVKQ